MKKENLIERIVRSEPLLDSKELLNWIERSVDNRDEFIRFKNIWALLQKGKEMSEEEIVRDYKEVRARIRKPSARSNIHELIKYAAIIIIALLVGYFSNSRNVTSEITMNEIMVPNGNRTSIVLPDGTKVWLTNNSKLIYPENFTGKTRNVTLEGEAFFNVAHNAKKPLIVNLGEQRVKVLGTEFSVVSYPDDNEIQIDLVSGKIQFDIENSNCSGNYKSYLLKPLHSLVLNKKSGKLIESKISDSFFSYWRNGEYEFKNESFEKLAKKIERIYGVEIIIEDKRLNNHLFTGTFNIDDNIYTMMEIFKQASGEPFTFSIDRDKIFIKSFK